MVSFQTEYPIWMLMFCLLAGGIYAFVLYRREKRFSDAPAWMRWMMPVLRFILIALISFFLLSPVMKHVQRTVERPLVLIALDRSSSLVSIADSGYYRKEFPESLQTLTESLTGKFDTACFSFGDRVVPGLDFSYSDKQTDFSELFREIETRYSNRNVGAVIIASDGLFNRGQNPVYQSAAWRYPVYTIALGDTTRRQDLILSNVLHNRIAYLNNQFPVEIQINARQLNGKSSVCTVSRNGTELFSKPVSITGADFSVTVPLMLDARETGIQRYTIRLSRVEGEISVENNARDIFIDVLDGREKILLLADAPHPDIAAIKTSLESNQNYETESALIGSFNGSLKSYSLIILHQLPSVRTPGSPVLDQIRKESVPLLYILGTQSSASPFNSWQTGLSVNGQPGKQTDALPVLAGDFSLFGLSDELASFVPSLPPLQCLFGDHKLNVPASVLFHQKIGMVETRQPLFLFSQSGERKTAHIAGEGLWRWKMQDMAEHGNTNLFNELILKTIQYLSVRPDKRFFRVYSRNSFLENEPVQLEAELYNDSYELINTPEVTITVTNEEGRKYPFTFSKTSRSYHLHAGLLPPGSYRYEAKTGSGTRLFSEKGEFTVIPLQVESTHTVADHGLLYTLSGKSGGEMFLPSDLGRLGKKLNELDSIAPVSRSEKQLSDLINIRWLFALILFLVTSEWVMRKMNGGY